MTKSVKARWIQTKWHRYIIITRNFFNNVVETSTLSSRSYTLPNSSKIISGMGWDWGDICWFFSDNISSLSYPLFFLFQANHYYKLFITWTSQKIKNTFVQRNMFEFKHIKPFDRSFIDNPGPMVVFATPGMLHAGLSLQIFRKWAPNDNNMVNFL